MSVPIDKVLVSIIARALRAITDEMSVSMEKTPTQPRPWTPSPQPTGSPCRRASAKHARRLPSVRLCSLPAVCSCWPRASPSMQTSPVP